MKRLLLLLLALAVLTGCASQPAPSHQPLQTQPPSAQTPPAEPPPPAAEPAAPPAAFAEVRLDWEGETRGQWPFPQTVELLRFCSDGGEFPELEAANGEMALSVENQKSRFDEAAEESEEQCRLDGLSWGSLWAYPVTTDRYLNAVVVQREHMHFRIDDARTWNLIDNCFVYDRQEACMVTLEDALSLAGVEQPGDLEEAVWDYTREQGIGTYEDLSSLGFYMDPEGDPVFIVGAVVYIPDAPPGWTTFFNWKDGEVTWCGEDPLPLYLVDTDQEALACLQGMGQYDGAAMISQQEALDTLCQIVEVQDALAMGMTLMCSGDTESIDGEEHLCIALGADNSDRFVPETLYAVSWYSVYYLDPYTGDWLPVGFG